MVVRSVMVAQKPHPRLDGRGRDAVALPPPPAAMTASWSRHARAARVGMTAGRRGQSGGAQRGDLHDPVAQRMTMHTSQLGTSSRGAGRRRRSGMRRPEAAALLWLDATFRSRPRAARPASSREATPARAPAASRARRAARPLPARPLHRAPAVSPDPCPRAASRNLRPRCPLSARPPRRATPAGSSNEAGAPRTSRRRSHPHRCRCSRRLASTADPASCACHPPTGR